MVKSHSTFSDDLFSDNTLEKNKPEEKDKNYRFNKIFNKIKAGLRISLCLLMIKTNAYAENKNPKSSPSITTTISFQDLSYIDFNCQIPLDWWSNNPSLDPSDSMEANNFLEPDIPVDKIIKLVWNDVLSPLPLVKNIRSQFYVRKLESQIKNTQYELARIIKPVTDFLHIRNSLLSEITFILEEKYNKAENGENIIEKMGVSEIKFINDKFWTAIDSDFDFKIAYDINKQAQIILNIDQSEDKIWLEYKGNF